MIGRLAWRVYRAVRRALLGGLADEDLREMDDLIAFRAEAAGASRLGAAWLWAREFIDLFVARFRYGPPGEGELPRGVRGRGHRTYNGGRSLMMMDVLRDLGYAGRSLRRSPLFTAVAVGTLALAIGVTAAIFSVVESVLLDRLPVTEPDRLVVIRGTAPASTELPDQFDLADEFYFQFRESAHLDDLAQVNSYTNSLRIGDEVERAWMSSPTTNAFDVLGVEPALGRLPASDESGEVALLSHALWVTRYGGDPGVLGQTIFATGGDRTIIGVMPPDFFLPSEATMLWVPFNPEESEVIPDVITGGFALIGRLAPGSSEEMLRRELPVLAERIPERFGGTPAYSRAVSEFRPVVTPIQEAILGDVAAPLWILFAGVMIVLLIACANVANLFTVRAEQRQLETAVRGAVGASRGRLVGSLFSEAVLVAGLAGVLALVLAWLAVPPLIAAAPPNVPRLANVSIGLPELGFAAIASVLCALTCGLAPALRASKPDLSRLRDGARGSTRRRHWWRDGLVAAQTALALVLLIGSGLLGQSFWALSNVDPGYDTEDIFTFQIAPEGNDLVDAPSYARFHMEFMERLRALPGVEAVGILENVPLDEGVATARFQREDQSGDSNAGALINLTFAAGDVFPAMGIDVLEGRALGPDDLVLGLNNIVISESTADLFWPGESPLGRRIQSESTGTTYNVVGVVEDILQYDLRDTPQPMAYLPLVGPTATAWVISSPGYVVRTERAEYIEPEVRALVHEVAPGAPMYRVHTMASLAADSIIEITFTTLMLAIVSALALILGAVGLYGILSYVVTQRTREIGVRMALGAEATRVRRMVVVQGARVVLAGIAVGLAIAVASTRALQGLLYGVEPADALTFVGTSLTLVLIGFLASYLPARRASSVDPIESLRTP